MSEEEKPPAENQSPEEGTQPESKPEQSTDPTTETAPTEEAPETDSVAQSEPPAAEATTDGTETETETKTESPEPTLEASDSAPEPEKPEEPIESDEGKIVWAQIAETPQDIHYKYLSKVINDLGVPNRYYSIEGDIFDFPDQLKAAQEKCDFILFGYPFRETMVEELHEVPVTVHNVKAADCLAKITNGWWPNNLMLDGIQMETAQYMEGVDLNTAALVVGTGSKVHFAVAALLKNGFKKISVTDADTQNGPVFVEKLRKMYFGIEFRFVSIEQLTLMSGNHSVLINTLPSDDVIAISELYYFNFMAENGIVIDLNFLVPNPPLMYEAIEFNLATVSGPKIMVAMDQMIARRYFDVEIEPKDYFKGLFIELFRDA